MDTSTPPSPDSLFARALDALLLRNEERKAARRSAETQARIALLARAADELASAARELDAAGRPHAVLFTHGHAIAMLVRAARVDAGAEDPATMTPREALDALGEAPPGAPSGFRELREALAEGDPASLFAIDDDRARSLAGAAAETSAWVAATVEPRSVAAIRSARAMRLAAAGLVALALVAVGLSRRGAPKNLALGRTATASSLFPTSPPNGGLVNGEIEKTFGVHTGVEQEPWVKVDLGAIVELGEARVFGRADGWFDEVVPLTLELSDDDAQFREVATRTIVLRQDDPWIVDLKGARARYVRLHRAQRGYIAVTELEVYGPGGAPKR
jgi:hypothetical protein